MESSKGSDYHVLDASPRARASRAPPPAWTAPLLSPSLSPSFLTSIIVVLHLSGMSTCYRDGVNVLVQLLYILARLDLKT